MELAQTVLKMRLTGGGICQSHIEIVINLCVCECAHMRACKHTHVWRSVSTSVSSVSLRFIVPGLGPLSEPAAGLWDGGILLSTQPWC